MITEEKTVLALKARKLFTVKTKRENVMQDVLSVFCDLADVNC